MAFLSLVLGLCAASALARPTAIERALARPSAGINASYAIYTKRRAQAPAVERNMVTTTISYNPDVVVVVDETTDYTTVWCSTSSQKPAVPPPTSTSIPLAVTATAEVTPSLATEVSSITRAPSPTTTSTFTTEDISSSILTTEDLLSSTTTFYTPSILSSTFEPSSTTPRITSTIIEYTTITVTPGQTIPGGSGLATEISTLTPTQYVLGSRFTTTVTVTPGQTLPGDSVIATATGTLTATTEYPFGTYSTPTTGSDAASPLASSSSSVYTYTTTGGHIFPGYAQTSNGDTVISYDFSRPVAYPVQYVGYVVTTTTTTNITVYL